MRIFADSWEILPIFRWIAATGSVSRAAMFDTFNMGIGYATIVPSSQIDRTIAFFEDRNIRAYNIGEVISGDGGLVGL